MVVILKCMPSIQLLSSVMGVVFKYTDWSKLSQTVYAEYYLECLQPIVHIMMHYQNECITATEEAMNE